MIKVMGLFVMGFMAVGLQLVTVIYVCCNPKTNETGCSYSGKSSPELKLWNVFDHFAKSQSN